MLSLLAALIVHHNDGGPYDWHMTCEAFAERRAQIMLDQHLDWDNKVKLINYLRTKVNEKCDVLLTYKLDDLAIF